MKLSGQKINRIGTIPFSQWCKNALESREYVILDTETTSRDGEIIELAIIAMNGEMLYEKRLKPILRIEEGARKIHGISQEALADAPTFGQEWRHIEPIIKERRIITYNAQFDSTMLMNSARLHKVDLPSMQWYCAMKEYAQLWNAPPVYGYANAPWQKLGEACKQQKVQLPKSHNFHGALGDCRATWMLIKRIAELGEEARTYKRD